MGRSPPKQGGQSRRRAPTAYSPCSRRPRATTSSAHFRPSRDQDHRIATFRRTRGQFGQKAVRALADHIEPGKVAGERTVVRVFVWRKRLLIERIDLFLLGALRPLPFWLGYSGSPGQCIQARGRQSPLWRFKEDAPTRGLT